MCMLMEAGEITKGGEDDQIIIFKNRKSDILRHFKVYYKIWKFRPGTQ